MTPLRVEETIDIAAPPAAVWRLLSRPDRWAEWVTNTDAVRRSTDEEVRPGTVYEEQNTLVGPVKTRSRWRVAEVEPERRVVHEAEHLPLARSMTVTFAMEPKGEGVRYTHGWVLESKLGPVAKLLRPMVRGDVRGSCENLKRLAEAEGGD